ncbi:Filamin-B [Chionoecetes opilio]|uniref:Filamin-B n=1 Tax=Chionoecetes opilio TaxID=41210 RepID=A0A8J4YF70_CHIOP|nr:Filamin-B [Chionoecetes opilio]
MREDQPSACSPLQVIQTLSGCYTGEFPHLPVLGKGRTSSLQGGRKDLISLRDLRRQTRPDATLALPHNSDDQDSPVQLLPSPPLLTNPLPNLLDTHLHMPTGSLLCTRSESLVSSVESEAEEGGEVMDDVQSQERYQEEEQEEETNGMDGKEEYVDTEEQRLMKQDVEAWCGCRAYGEGLQRGSVRAANAFMVDTSEAEWGEVSVSVEGPREGTVSATEVYQVEGQAAGVYQVLYWVTCPATYHISITWAGQHIVGSPFPCAVQA